MTYRPLVAFGIFCYCPSALGLPWYSNTSIFLTKGWQRRQAVSGQFCPQQSTQAQTLPSASVGCCNASISVEPTAATSQMNSSFQTVSSAALAAAEHVVASSTVPPIAVAVQTGQAYTGDITYYDVSVGIGSCGTIASNSDNVVALSHLDMNNPANPNANPLCGKEITIYYNGATHHARIWDTCPTCGQGSLDLPQPLFDAVAPGGDGRVHGVTWRFS